MLLLLFCSMHTICTNQSHTARKTISHNEMHSTGFNMTSISNMTEKLEARIKISQSWPIICTFCLHLYITFYITCSKGPALHICFPFHSVSFSLSLCVWRWPHGSLGCGVWPSTLKEEHLGPFYPWRALQLEAFTSSQSALHSHTSPLGRKRA